LALNSSCLDFHNEPIMLRASSCVCAALSFGLARTQKAGDSFMVRAQTFRIGERFEIARALFQAVKWLAWKRRLLALLAAFGLLVASVSSVLLAFTILLRFAEILPALTFIWLARFVIALGIVSSALSIWVGVRWLVRERLDQVLRAVDDALVAKHSETLLTWQICERTRPSFRLNLPELLLLRLGASGKRRTATGSPKP
jgi:hypothetical protein